MIKKRITPASVTAQKKWSKFPLGLKKELGRILPDTDRDGVPNGFDCRPKNRRKQESFLAEDANYLNGNPNIKLGSMIGTGASGDVFAVKGNKNLVVKVPKRAMSTETEMIDTHRGRAFTSVTRIEDEMARYNQLNLENEPLCIPSKMVRIQQPNLLGSSMFGIVRPKVKPYIDYSNPVSQATLKKLNDTQLETIRRKLIQLSWKGIRIYDGLQIGVDRAGRPLIYDLEWIEDANTKGKSIDSVFEANNHTWLRFLFDTGKIRDTNNVKYGYVTMAERY
jgi:hypothetical protein